MLRHLRTSTVWPLDRSIEYFEDVFRLFAMTINATGNKINFGELQAVSCFDPDDYITTFRSGRKLSLVLRQTSSFAGATGWIFIAFLVTPHISSWGRLGGGDAPFQLFYP